MGATPTIPTLPTSAPQISVSQPSGEDTAIADLLKGINAPVTAPSTILGTAPLQPARVPQPRVVAPPTPTVPMGPGASYQKQASKVAGIKGILNAVSRVGAAVENRKNEVLTHNIKTIMDAQQQISNAQQVLSVDPNNANAKKVIADNKGVVEALLSDPKTNKQISKAFDISFVDPTKNDTPEIKAGQKAVQQHNESQKAGMTADNPAEAAVQKQAQALSQAQESQAAQQKMAQAGATRPTQVPSATQVATGARSSTPYADQFLSKQPSTIEANPQYAEQVKAQQELQKAVLPRVITGIMQQQMQGAKDQAAAERENLRAQTSYNTVLKDIDVAKIAAQGRADLEKLRELNSQKLELERERASFSRQMAAITLRENLRANGKLPANKQQAMDLAIYRGAESISATALKKVTDLEIAKKAGQDNTKGGLSPEQLKFYDTQINIAKDQMMDAAHKQQAAADRLKQEGYDANVSGSSDQSKSTTVGDDISDEDDTDESDEDIADK